MIKDIRFRACLYCYFCLDFVLGKRIIDAPVTRLTVGVMFALLAVAGLSLGWVQRDELLAEWKSKKKYFLTIEGLFLAFFLFDLLIRIGNPDLWHPSKGGERPMDFSFFNAILKSISFPPYDLWFAGGYINYYYYGFVLVGMPVKLLALYRRLPTTLFCRRCSQWWRWVRSASVGIWWTEIKNRRWRMGTNLEKQFLISDLSPEYWPRC